MIETALLLFGIFVIRISDLFRISDFGFYKIIGPQLPRGLDFIGAGNGHGLREFLEGPGIGAAEFVGRFLYRGATYMRGERDGVTADLLGKAVEESFCRCHDQGAIAASFASRTGAAVLAAVSR